MTALTVLLAAAGAMVAGFVIAWRLLASAADSRAEGLFREWRADTAKRATRQALLASGVTTKDELGRQLDGWVPAMPFAAADVRFVGHPVALVVFDGHSELRARYSDRLRQVVLVTDLGDGAPSADAELVEACVRAGRVRWETLRLATEPGPHP